MLEARHSALHRETQRERAESESKRKTQCGQLVMTLLCDLRRNHSPPGLSWGPSPIQASQDCCGEPLRWEDLWEVKSPVWMWEDFPPFYG